MIVSLLTCAYSPAKISISSTQERQDSACYFLLRHAVNGLNVTVMPPEVGIVFFDTVLESQQLDTTLFLDPVQVRRAAVVTRALRHRVSIELTPKKSCDKHLTVRVARLLDFCTQGAPSQSLELVRRPSNQVHVCHVAFNEWSVWRHRHQVAACGTSVNACQPLPYMRSQQDHPISGTTGEWTHCPYLLRPNDRL